MLLHLIKMANSFDLRHLIVVAVRYQLWVLLHILFFVDDGQLTILAFALLADDLSRDVSTFLILKSIDGFLIPTHDVSLTITLIFLAIYRVDLVFHRGKIIGLAFNPLMLENSPQSSIVLLRLINFTIEKEV